jgi:hypothetical protein
MIRSTRYLAFVTALAAKTPSVRFHLAVFVAAILTIQSLAATGDKSPSNGVESLGGRLLDDLSPDVAQPAAPAQSAPKSNATKEIEDSSKAPIPPRGFGAGANPTSQSLARVQSSMQQAQSLLTKTGADGKSGAVQLASPVQHEVLSDLDNLIADLSKQCQCCNGQCQGGQCNKPPGQNPKSGKPGAAGRTAARDSTDRLDSSSARPVDKGEVNEMVKALWGQLPERSREQMLQSFSDEFLPKYELEIEQYYRRLSEEQDQNQSK